MTVRPGADHRPRVLYYAHQHGAGHVHHARTLIATGAFDVTVVTAHPRAVAMLPDGADVVPLPSDLVDGHVQPPGSPLHWTPVGPQIQQRFGTLLAAAQRVEPDVVVVDVSVEAALFLRLAGYPVIHRRMHGDRIDAAHELVYAQADALVAYYCAGLENPAWLQRFGDKAVHLGTPDVTGRLGEQARTVRGLDAGGAPRIVVVTGTGGGGVQRAEHAAHLHRALDRHGDPGEPWPDRVLILASAIPVAVLSNVIRIALTGVLYNEAGKELGDRVFHDFAGWMMMPFALAILWAELKLLDWVWVETGGQATSNEMVRVNATPAHLIMTALPPEKGGAAKPVPPKGAPR